MSARFIVADDTPIDPDKARQDWLFQAKDSILACRGQGHNWPKITPGKPRKGIRVRYMPERNGQVEIVATCLDCGKKRRVITGTDGIIPLPAKYYYEDPEGFKTPKGVRVTRRECFRESNRRWVEDVKARFEGVPPTYETASNEDIPLAKFSG